MNNIISEQYHLHLKQLFQAYYEIHPFDYILDKKEQLFHQENQDITNQILKLEQQTPFQLTEANKRRLEKILEETKSFPSSIISFHEFKKQQQWKNTLKYFSKIPSSVYSSYQ